jgi:ankyrin repeat protein
MACKTCAGRFKSAADARAEAKRLEAEEARNLAADTVKRWHWPGTLTAQPGAAAKQGENPKKAMADDLFFATDRGDASAVKTLLAYGADVNTRDDYGRTLLSIASRRDRLGVVRTLLASGADVNAPDSRAELPHNAGMTPLHWAAARGHKSVLELLLANKAAVDARDHQGLTPLHAALDSCPENVEEVVRLLLSAGSDINATTDLGFTPLQVAAARAAGKVRSNLPDLVRQLGGHE